MTGFEHVVERDAWDDYPVRFHTGMDKILAILGRHGVKATFFFLGSICHGTSKSIRKTRFDKPRTGSPSASDISKIRRPGQAVR